MIAAINGPVTVHPEYSLLCDIVLAAEDAYFQDAPHPAFGIVPGGRWIARRVAGSHWGNSRPVLFAERLKNSRSAIAKDTWSSARWADFSS
jgi:enoyl-CoA hydratase/carnithine racemase